jgi:hypothetical protein
VASQVLILRCLPRLPPIQNTSNQRRNIRNSPRHKGRLVCRGTLTAKRAARLLRNSVGGGLARESREPNVMATPDITASHSRRVSPPHPARLRPPQNPFFAVCDRSIFAESSGCIQHVSAQRSINEFAKPSLFAQTRPSANTLRPQLCTTSASNLLLACARHAVGRFPAVMRTTRQARAQNRFGFIPHGVNRCRARRPHRRSWTPVSRPSYGHDHHGQSWDTRHG